jgi:lipid-A-disaccharide synthase
MQAAGMACDFVGHPVVAEPQATAAEIATLRRTSGLGDAPVLLVLPGSRRGEVERLAPIFGDAAGRFLATRPDWRIVVPAAAPVAEQVRAAVDGWPGMPLVIDPGAFVPDMAQAMKRAAFGTAELALAASGTVSLELAAAGTPMVTAYDVNLLSRLIAQMLVRIDSLTLVNLVSDTRAVPEYMGAACRPDRIAAGLEQVQTQPQTQRLAMEVTLQRLGRGGEAPGLRAARAVLARM